MHSAEELSRIQGALPDRYSVVEKVADGGMGSVFRVRDAQLDRELALKVVRGVVSNEDERRRFHREISVVARLEHPHIVPLIDSGTGDGLAYFMMPFVSGETLKERLSHEGALPVDEAVRMSREIAAGLACAHDAGVIHRDVKPSNVLLSDGHARLADFGLARSLAEDVSTLTRSDQVLGTAQYMSPEAIDGGTVGKAGDVYSLGCVLFEMLTGRPPFQHLDWRATLAAKVTRASPRTESVRPDLPKELSALVDRAIARSPGARFADAGEMLQALEAIQIEAVRPRFSARSAAWAGLIATATIGGLVALEAVDNPSTGSGAIEASSWERVTWSSLSATEQRVASLSGADVTPSVQWVKASADRILLDPSFSNNLWVGGADQNWSAHPIYSRDAAWLPPMDVGPTIGLIARNGLTALWQGDSLSTWLPPPMESVEAAWSDGTEVIVGGRNGGVRRWNGSEWILEDVPSEATVTEMWGDTQADLFLIAHGPRDTSSELWRRTASGWAEIGLPSGTDAVIAGSSHPDGHSLVLAETCSVRRSCESRVLELTPSGAWSDLGINFPRGFSARGIGGGRSGEVVVWGTGSSCQSCSFLLDGRNAREIPGTDGRTIQHVTASPTAVVGVASDGLTWRLREREWRPITTAPPFGIRAVAASPTVGPVAIAGSDGILSERFWVELEEGRYARQLDTTSFVARRSESLPPPFPSLVRISVGASRVAFLTDSATVLAADCRAGSGGQFCTRSSIGMLERGMRDLTVLRDGTIVVVGDGGRAVTIGPNGVTAESTPDGTGDLTVVRVSPLGAAVAAGPSALIRRVPGGQWHAEARHCSSICDGIPTDVAVLSDGWVAVSVRKGESHSVDLFQPETRLGMALFDLPGHSWADPPTLVHALPDGTLLVGFRGRPTQGSASWLELVPAPYDESLPIRIPLPHGVALSDVADDGAFLYVAGTGWDAFKIELDRLRRLVAD